ncbi:MAG: hypothetical protein CMJ83_06635 [Planctomycetes bacterium]|nr:hypothetical protein [Planctomycetota bacterium]
MSSSSLRIIVTGYIAQYPLGGMTWHYFHYVLGLMRLGHDVYYIEDTGQWPYDPVEDGITKTCEDNVRYLQELMEQYGLEDRWAYRFVWKERWFGMADERREDVIRTADLVINVSGTLERPGEYRHRARLAYVDTDPVFTQVKLAKGHDYLRGLVDQHDVLFSFGESPGDDTPDTEDQWNPTRQPIALDIWRPSEPHRDVYTTVMTWKAFKPIVFEGKKFGQKDVEFERFVDLPEHIRPATIEVAANAGRGRRLPRQDLIDKGWRLVEPREACPDHEAYRRYIEGSKGEWSVAKNAYVVGQAAWFSCRSACYLAAGRPVILQETGFSKVLPTGKGLFAYRTLEEAAEAIRTVEADYPTHAAAARAIAEEYFDGRTVLARVIDVAMNPHPEVCHG